MRADASGSTIRTLPIRVRAVPNESATSYFRRLCAANMLDPHDAWLYLRHHDASLQFRIKPRAARPHIARLGGLPTDFFSSTGSDAECRHDPAFWMRSCDGCRTGTASTAICHRCSGGAAALSYVPAGPICLKHKRWHIGGVDVDATRLRSHLAAQRRLNGLFHRKRIGFRSPEATTARDLLFEWHTPRERNVAALSPDEQLDSFPMLVDLLIRLSSAMMTAILQDRKIPGDTIARVLLLVTDGVRRGESLASSIDQVTTGAHVRSPVRPPALPWLLREIRPAATDPRTRHLRARLPTIRAALLRHRDQRASFASAPEDARARRPRKSSPGPTEYPDSAHLNSPAHQCQRASS